VPVKEESLQFRRTPCASTSRSAQAHWHRIAWPHTWRSAIPSKGGACLCNSIVLFDDAGALLPGGHVLVPPATVGPAEAALCAAA
jgi:hypothetical protein